MASARPRSLRRSGADGEIRRWRRRLMSSRPAPRVWNGTLGPCGCHGTPVAVRRRDAGRPARDMRRRRGLPVPGSPPIGTPVRRAWVGSPGRPGWTPGRRRRTPGSRPGAIRESQGSGCGSPEPAGAPGAPETAVEPLDGRVADQLNDVHCLAGPVPVRLRLGRRVWCRSRRRAPTPFAGSTSVPVGRPSPASPASIAARGRRRLVCGVADARDHHQSGTRDRLGKLTVPLLAADPVLLAPMTSVGRGRALDERPLVGLLALAGPGITLVGPSQLATQTLEVASGAGPRVPRRRLVDGPACLDQPFSSVIREPADYRVPARHAASNHGRSRGSSAPLLPAAAPAFAMDPSPATVHDDQGLTHGPGPSSAARSAWARAPDGTARPRERRQDSAAILQVGPHR